MREIADLMVEAEGRVKMISANLPKVVDAAAISPIAKMPFKVICFREGLLWRAEELGRAACERFKAQDVVAAILLTRGLAETAAAVWFLRDLVKRQLADGFDDDLDQKLMRMIVGSRNDDRMPQAINILAFCDRVEKFMPGFRASYDALSEFAHPNWSGVAGAYSKTNRAELRTEFGRGIRNTQYPAEVGLKALIGSLMIFETAYNEIANLMEDFVIACEKNIRSNT